MTDMPQSGLEGARRIVAALETADVRLAPTVPDTWIGRLAGVMRQSRSLRVVDVASEEEAIAIAAGAALVGTRAVVAIQNAGLLNCGAILASLITLYRIPCVLLVSYRGDERDPVYYHVPKGRITEPTLDAWGIRYAHAAGRDGIADQLVRALTWVEEARAPFVLLFTAEDLA